MAIDLKNLSPKELQALIANANAQMHQARATQVQFVKQKIETLLSDNGLTLNDVYPSRGKKTTGKNGSKGVVAPKYRNPSNPSETWSGRGRQPAWFAKALKRRGVTVDSLLIADIAKSKALAKETAPSKKAGKGEPKKVAKRASERVTTAAKA